MIRFYAARNFLWGMERFIAGWAPHLAGVIHPTAYDDVRVGEPLPAGAHVFADFERLLPRELALVRRLHHTLADQPDSYVTLNDPAAWTGRLGLLQDLAELGINDFRAYRLTGLDAEVRFPAFLRWANEHSGSLGAVVHSDAELKARVKEKVGLRRRFDPDLLVVEHADAQDPDGMFRKYSAMKIGDRLIPRHVLVSRRWMVKKPMVITPAIAEEEQEFVDTFPHEDVLRRVYAVAGIDYGRIDYGFSNGRLQVWEINTNPVIVPLPDQIDPSRLLAQTQSAAAIVAAFEELAARAPTTPGGPAFNLRQRVAWATQARMTRRYDRRRV